uniref:Uncharacterized protein n=1 Tax=Myripristis murdjan TaxID=586833 RepID=A0A667XXK3_9TELE
MRVCTQQDSFSDASREPEDEGDVQTSVTAPDPAQPDDEASADAELVSGTDSTSPVSVPVSQDEPVSVPAAQDEAVSIPVSQDEAVSVPVSQDEAVSVPAAQDEAVSVPAAQDEPVSVPVSQDEPVSVPNKRMRGFRKFCSRVVRTLFCCCHRAED